MSDVNRARPAKRRQWLFAAVIGLLALTDVLIWVVLWNPPNPISAAMVSPLPPQAHPLPTPVFQAVAAHAPVR